MVGTVLMAGTSLLGTDRPNVCYNPGVVWISRLGHTYEHRPPAILETLPAPIPRDRPPCPLTIPLDDGWEDTEIWEDLPPPPDPEPDPPPGTDPSADIPPF